MPEIKSRDISIAVDMHGCPNWCRHCWIGRPPNGRMTEDDLRWTVSRFREFVRPGEDRPFIENLNVVTWTREPDFSDDYRRLYDLEVELSDTKTYRAEWELLSVWRLARDKEYAPWAKNIGVETAQITFFGVGETQDWFYRRKGAFRDCVTAIERLLDAGIKPRWQFILTKKMIPEIGELLKLVERLKLRERVAALGGEFVMFMHTPGPEGDARFIEHLRPSIDEIGSIPSEIIEASRRHFKSEELWHTVGERISQILSDEEDHFPYAWSYQEQLFFCIQCNWDVYSNMGTQEPWWKLGNLKTDPLETIFESFEENRTPPLRTIFTLPLRNLASRYGDPSSRLIDGGVEGLWVAEYCESQFG